MSPPTAQGKPGPSVLTQEEKEILKDRELLEHIGLLQNLELIQLLDFLSPGKPTPAKAPEAGPPIKDDEKKKKSD